MPTTKSIRAYIWYSVTTSIVWQVILVIVVLWGLPRFGINVPVWLLIVFMAALGAYSYVTFRLGKKALSKAPAVGFETIIGSKGEATTPLSPYGYVRIGSELWRARSTGGNVHKGSGVVVTGMSELTLLVSPLYNNLLPTNSKHDTSEKTTGLVRHH